MGATGLSSIQYTGSGLLFGFGQAFEPGERWSYCYIEDIMWE